MKNFQPCPSFMATIALTMFALGSCNQAAKLEERNKAIVIKANDELLNKGNAEYADAVFASDYRKRGPQVIKEYVLARRTAFPDLEVKIDHVVAEGDRVAWMRTNTATLRNEYRGHKPSGKKISWRDMVVTRYTDDGKIAEEWGVSDMNEALENANGIDGIYEYLPPLKGQSVNRHGKFVYLFGPADGKGPMVSQAGTYELSGDTVTNTVTYCTDRTQVGTAYRWTPISWSGDTATYAILTEKGAIATTGRAIKVSN